jgi:predicted polyphosphate/ATP-dependent NAD kinase
MIGRIGLIVNPIAGMGGRVGLKGTDGEAILREAVARGAKPVAHDRAVTALKAAAQAAAINIVTPSGAMGETAALAAGLEPIVVGAGVGPETTADDTRTAALDLVSERCDLLLFAGGDGTARDIYTVVERQIPMLGIPTGVKMHSAVFGVGPASTGRLAAEFVTETHNRMVLKDCEIMDIDEDAQRAGQLSARLYGYACVPYERLVVQSAKAGGHSEDVELDGLAAEIAAAMEPGVLYVVGPGGTAKRVLRHLELEGTLLGVDLVRDGALVDRDASEEDILRHAGGNSMEIIVGVVGGQGFVFGRGNQQISAKVLSCTDADRIIIMAGAGKLAALNGDRLFVDTGSVETDGAVCGYRRVRTGPGRSAMMRLVPA